MSESFPDWMARLRAGDAGAAAEVFRRFAGRLIGLARSRLDGWVRAKEDPEDVVQSVYKSFFMRCGAGQFELGTWDELWSLLTVLTLRKCAGRAEHFRARRRDVASEVPLPGPGDSAAGSWEALDREPTPEEAALLTEAVEQLLAGLGGDDRAIIELSLQGHTTEEISGRLGFSSRTVRRVRERAKKRLERMGAA
jgi:RNA polymerase sigma-70 factor (ECF subfamily)